MSWQEVFDQIAADNIHGASFLVRKTCEALKSIEDPKELDRAIARLPHLQPYMAPFYHLATFLREHGAADIAQSVALWLRSFESDNARVASKCAKMIRGKSVLVHSASSAVFTALSEANDVQVLLTESRPKREGEAMCKKLCEEGIESRLIIDAAAGYMMERVDMVLFGADGVGDFGLVHKIGSYLIALAAKERGKEVIALAPPQKWWPSGFCLPPQPLRDPREISEQCEAYNYYFDVTPHHLLTQIIK